MLAPPPLGAQNAARFAGIEVPNEGSDNVAGLIRRHVDFLHHAKEPLGHDAELPIFELIGSLDRPVPGQNRSSPVLALAMPEKGGHDGHVAGFGFCAHVENLQLVRFWGESMASGG